MNPESPVGVKKFAGRGNAEIVPVTLEELEAKLKGHELSKDAKSGFNDEKAQFLALQEERRKALWSEVHDGFGEVISSFQEFKEVLHGDVNMLGMRLNEKQKKKIQEKIKIQEYVTTLEGMRSS